jgi:hypothetical protein
MIRIPSHGTGIKKIVPSGEKSAIRPGVSGSSQDFIQKTPAHLPDVLVMLS